MLLGYARGATACFGALLTLAELVEFRKFGRVFL
jgi:hypothetical protein